MKNKRIYKVIRYDYHMYEYWLDDCITKFQQIAPITYDINYLKTMFTPFYIFRIEGNWEYSVYKHFLNKYGVDIRDHIVKFDNFYQFKLESMPLIINLMRLYLLEYYVKNSTFECARSFVKGLI